MTNLITRSYTFTDGTTAYGSQVDSEIANIVNTVNSLDQANTTWSNVKVTTLLPLADVAMAGHKITGLANGTASADAVTYSQLTGVAGAITGSLLMYPLKAPPSGYLYCDGSAVSRGTYATLYGIVGNTFGRGDNSTTFNLPDYRGKFLRGVNDGSGNDPDAANRSSQATGGNTGDAAGTIQNGSNASHTHTASVTDPGHTHPEQGHNNLGGGATVYIAVGAGTNAGSPLVDGSTDTRSGFTGLTVSNASVGGLESKPINSAIYFHIKI